MLPRPPLVRTAASRLSGARVWGSRHCTTTPPEPLITVERRGAVGLLTLNRPRSMNALSPQLVKELAEHALAFDAEAEIGAIVVTGAGKAFAAGADIKLMKDQGYMDMYKQRLFSHVDQLSLVSKPVIAAVHGFALGGGCELAMACDFILAAESTKFGQPEIKLGTVPGLGGTQRFARAVGKSRAMELVLTGDFIGAEEACARGLVSRVVADANLLEDAISTANRIAQMSQPATAMAKACSLTRPFSPHVTAHVRRICHILVSLSV